MKIINYKYLFFLFLFASTVSFSAETDSIIKIGNDLDLFAVLETFKTSNSIQTFEDKLNSKNEKINNLDLIEDGNIDYIKVIDRQENSSHAIILRIDIDAYQSQDVAVIEIEKTGDNTASVQIIGDVDLYGTNYIVEPQLNDDQTKSILNVNALIFVNVWRWHPIQHIYSPNYTVWVSPYRWHYYPSNWRTWKPYNRNTYYNFHKHHHTHYHVVRHHHSTHAHTLYNKHRKHSATIKQHHNHHSNHKVGHKTSQHKSVHNHATSKKKETHNTPTKNNKKSNSSKQKTRTNKAKKSSSRKKGKSSKK
jgi:hypothetical protein